MTMENSTDLLREIEEGINCCKLGLIKMILSVSACLFSTP